MFTYIQPQLGGTQPSDSTWRAPADLIVLTVI
jgi:hypothetical protein